MNSITLGEALNNRADLQTKIAQLTTRLGDNIKVQEGDAPALSPQTLKMELFAAIDALGALIERINKTNIATDFDERRKLSEALIERENLMKKRQVVQQMIDKASENSNRYSMSEIKFISVVNVEALSKEYDQLSKLWRELDNQIQAINWRTELL